MSNVQTVLLLGRTTDVVEKVVQWHTDTSDMRLIGGTTIDDVRSALAVTNVDHVIMGAGLDLETRVHIVQEIFQSSDRTTVHMKDVASGPDGLLPFVSVLLEALNRFAIGANRTS